MSSNNGSRVWNGLDRDWHEEFDRAVKATVKWYQWDIAKGLVLAGDTGSGKTSLARIVYQAAGGNTPFTDQQNGEWVTARRAVMYSEPDLLEDIRSGYGSGDGAKKEAGILRVCRMAQTLILDDVGAAYVKPESQAWYEDIMWRLLNERASGGRKTMLTTNLSPTDLKIRIGKRANSRLKEILAGAEFYVMMFNVPDYREKGWATSRPSL